MTVNDAKTQLLCISGNTDNDINSYIRIDETTEINGGEELKLLGFWFGRRPNADVHVSKLCNKFRTRLWALRHLKRSGMDESDLKAIYMAVLRPVLDFASPTYHPLLTKTQSDKLEALQKRASKIIYGVERSYSSVLESGDLEALADRRKKLCLNFAKTAASSERFGSLWFPRKDQTGHNTQRPEVYVEEKVRTERMKKNPLNYMRHELNKLHYLY